MRLYNFESVVAAVMLAGGCAGGIVVSDQGPPPDLVYAAPGVQVIADYDEPIFYSDNFYWRFSSGRWYRSPYYSRGWVSAAPPPAVLRIDRPHQYAHYRPSGWAPRGGMRGSPPPARYESPRRPEPAAPRSPPYQPPPARAAAPPSRAAPSGMRGTPPPAPVRGRHDDHEHHDRH